MRQTASSALNLRDSFELPPRAHDECWLARISHTAN